MTEAHADRAVASAAAVSLVRPGVLPGVDGQHSRVLVVVVLGREDDEQGATEQLDALAAFVLLEADAELVVQILHELRLRLRGESGLREPLAGLVGRDERRLGPRHEGSLYAREDVADLRQRWPGLRGLPQRAAERVGEVGDIVGRHSLVGEFGERRADESIELVGLERGVGLAQDEQRGDQGRTRVNVGG
ncbi:hypothetical protein [Nannocystis sp.]|uniref:hypothetical protein n=1 Tax=Nannocystis sp. TaxID=1962667 RepID=UPI0025F5509E|nr:hypothetical protein [Nannocystis sp.]